MIYKENYLFQYKKDTIKLEINTPNSDIQFHVLLPEKTKAVSVIVNAKKIYHQNLTIEKSCYVDFDAQIKKRASILIDLTKE